MGGSGSKFSSGGPSGMFKSEELLFHSSCHIPSKSFCIGESGVADQAIVSESNIAREKTQIEGSIMG